MNQVEMIPNDPKPTCNRRHLFAVWSVLILVIVAVMNRERILSLFEGKAATQTTSRGIRDFAGLDDVQAKTIVGFQRMIPKQAKEVVEGSKSLDQGDPIQRLRYVALVNEMLGPDAGLEALAKLETELTEKNIAVAEADRETFDLVYSLLEAYSQRPSGATTLDDDARATIEKRLGWPGKLLLNPAVEGKEPSTERQKLLQPALRTAFALIGLVTWMLFGGFAGLVGLFMLILLWMNGKLASRLGSPSPHGVIYCETFILWLVLLFSLTGVLPRYVSIGMSGLLWSALAMFLSLGTLVWPVLRGVPWQRVRGDIGLTWGEQPILNVLSGLGMYFMMLPLAALGMSMFFGLLVMKSRLASGGEARVEDYAHPLVEAIASKPPVWHVYLLAAIAAPIVEEIMFRGVFYRHLREATRCCRTTTSFLISMIINSTIFAIIHPQGLMAAPILAGLAFGLTIAREWRGSLVACIIPHSINNFVVSTLAVSLFG